MASSKHSGCIATKSSKKRISRLGPQILWIVIGILTILDQALGYTIAAPYAIEKMVERRRAKFKADSMRQDAPVLMLKSSVVVKPQGSPPIVMEAKPENAAALTSQNQPQLFDETFFWNEISGRYSYEMKLRGGSVVSRMVDVSAAQLSPLTVILLSRQMNPVNLALQKMGFDLTQPDALAPNPTQKVSASSFSSAGSKPGTVPVVDPPIPMLLEHEQHKILWALRSAQGAEFAILAHEFIPWGFINLKKPVTSSAGAVQGDKPFNIEVTSVSAEGLCQEVVVELTGYVFNIEWKASYTQKDKLAEKFLQEKQAQANLDKKRSVASVPTAGQVMPPASVSSQFGQSALKIYQELFR